MHPDHRRELIYDFIDRFVIAHKRGPAWREIADGLGVSYETVRADLRILRDRGCVSWKPHTPYTLRVADNSLP